MNKTLMNLTRVVLVAALAFCVITGWMAVKENTEVRETAISADFGYEDTYALAKLMANLGGDTFYKKEVAYNIIEAKWNGVYKETIADYIYAHYNLKNDPAPADFELIDEVKETLNNVHR